MFFDDDCAQIRASVRLKLIQFPPRPCFYLILLVLKKMAHSSFETPFPDEGAVSLHTTETPEVDTNQRVVLLDAFLPTTTAAAAAVDVLGRMEVWWSSVDGDDDAGSQNNANLFSRGRFQLPFLPGVAFFALSQDGGAVGCCPVIFIIPVPILNRLLFSLFCCCYY